MNPVMLNLAPAASDQAADGSVGIPNKSAGASDTDAFSVLLSHRLLAAQVASKSRPAGAPVPTIRTKSASEADAAASKAKSDPDGAVDLVAKADHSKLEAILEPLAEPGSAQSDPVAAASTSRPSAPVSDRTATKAPRDAMLESAIGAVDAVAKAGRPQLEAMIEPLIDLGPAQSDGAASAPTQTAREAAAAASIQAAAQVDRLGAKTSLALQIDAFNIQSRAQATVGKTIASTQAAPAAGTETQTVDAEIAKILASIASRSQIAGAASPAGPIVALASEPKTALAGKAERALEAKITKLIESGASQADIIGSLAAQLATSVSGQLELPSADARGKLQTVFATALAPPHQTGSSGSASIRARALAQRFIQLESVASTIAGGQSGQQNRIAGNLLDAHGAKDIPAQTTPNDPIAATALVAPIAVPNVRRATDVPASPAPARASSVSPAASSDVAATPALPDSAAFAGGALLQPGATRPAGDGRTVQLGKAAPIATGGDTGLGRILARASLAADARETPVAPASGIAASAPVSDATASQTAMPTSETAASSPAASISLGGSAAASAGSSAAVLSAFLKSFEAALKGSTTAGAPDVASSDTPTAAIASPVLPATADSSAAFVPTVAPFAIVRAEPVAAPAAATAAPIDHSAIADQVLRGAFMRNTGESSEIRLRLVPDSLGDVSVKLIVSDGTVTAHVVADTPAVRDVLVAAQPQLTKSLADAGLKLTSFTVDVSGGGFAGFSGQSNDQSQNGGRPRRWTNSPDPDDTHDETRLEAIPSFAPPGAPRANRGDFNYLV